MSDKESAHTNDELKLIPYIRRLATEKRYIELGSSLMMITLLGIPMLIIASPIIIAGSVISYIVGRFSAPLLVKKSKTTKD